MDRRAFISTVGLGLLAAPPAAGAQPAGTVPRIGYLSIAGKPSPRDEAFAQGLRELGWVDGQNITIEYRWAANKPESLATLTDKLVGLKVNLIVAAYTPAVQAAKNATKTIPVVMIEVADTVASGRDNQYSAGACGEAARAAQRDKIRFQPFVLASVNKIGGAFAALKKERAGVLIVQSLFGSLGQGRRIADLAARNRIPTIPDGFQLAEEGALMFYGPDPIEAPRRAAGRSSPTCLSSSRRSSSWPSTSRPPKPLA